MLRYIRSIAVRKTLVSGYSARGIANSKKLVDNETGTQARIGKDSNDNDKGNDNRISIYSILGSEEPVKDMNLSQMLRNPPIMNRRNNTKFLLNSLTNSLDKVQSINNITKILNDNNLPKDKDFKSIENQHFNSIINGLDLIHSNKLDNMNLFSLKFSELRKLIKSITNEQQLIELFDNFYYTGKLTSKLTIEILFNKNFTKISYIIDKIFNNNNNNDKNQGNYLIKNWKLNNFNDLDIAILQKNYSLKNYEIVQKLLYKNFNKKWLLAIKKNELSSFAERVLWKFLLLTKPTIEVINLAHEINLNKSYWLLWESFAFLNNNNFNDKEKLNSIKNYLIDLLNFINLQKNNLTHSQSLILKFANNDFLQMNSKFLNDLIYKSISFNLSSKSSTMMKNNDKLLIRELTQILINLNNKYPDYDFIDLNNALNNYISMKSGKRVDNNFLSGNNINIDEIIGLIPSY
ncbi:hypothetical protein PACTADRAFT_76707 [Pachysolen tannophilus NRRL Y-2460]|uniref:Uncharacterized protein n=1 Tax=Pachysolen tannophilus NRRL Y-2460 TaxID=669874 RepID=A0A1E4TQM5_PACTA|nr:hypothetical protein PACTADRAFT_76707 [Pachysolen tannophilus NRRL Y-2460]